MLTCFFFATGSYAQVAKSKKIKTLQNFDFLGDTTSAALKYEQKLFRNPYIGMYQLSRSLGDSNIKEYIPMFQGVALGAYTLTPTMRFRALGKEEISNPGFLLKKYKVDLWLQPVFEADFGNREKTLQSNTSLMLQTQFQILKGLVVNAGILFPITNDMDNRPKKIRPAPIFLNHFLSTGKNFISASAGYFHNDQYGVNVQYRHQDFTSSWSFGLETGLTGFYYYAKKGLYYETMENLIVIGDVAYRFMDTDLLIKLSGGRYLDGDAGARLEMIRQFANVEVALYVMKTSNGTTGGFNFAVPLPPGKIIQTRNFRFRTTDEFRWEYSYSRGFHVGQRYRTGYQLDQKLRQYHVRYVARQHQ
ncbi:YjbH domain-containing protein [Dyadobacter alkalitolerans]|uniref:YjbH domain-containing protein n=1 Tax=Dyadobacter alkalitolerans TaxID=492736 RepID=UPI00041CA570|nr:YjbH domain-containing protein [Dyadobacter alkalitolerans]